MIYLILQILFCLLIAFLIGLLFGWFLGKASRKPAKLITPEQAEAYSSKFQAAPPPPPARKPAAAPDNSSPAKAKLSRPTDLGSEVNLEGAGYEIETLEGVGPKTGEALRDIGINTISDLLKKGYNASKRADIAAEIAVRPNMVDGWASMADLLRIKGVDHQSAELMHASGVQTVADLAQQNPTAFIAKMDSVNTAGKRSIAPEVPSTSQMKDWIAQASKLKAVIDL